MLARVIRIEKCVRHRASHDGEYLDHHNRCLGARSPHRAMVLSEPLAGGSYSEYLAMANRDVGQTP